MIKWLRERFGNREERLVDDSKQLTAEQALKIAQDASQGSHPTFMLILTTRDEQQQWKSELYMNDMSASQMIVVLHDVMRQIVAASQPDSERVLQ